MTSNSIQQFDFNHQQVRVLADEQGETWFVGKDVCDILGYANASKALQDHVDLEDKLNNESLSSLGQRGGWLINESGLYSLVLSSKLPSAREFKHWVTSEVLPSIRKTGGYIPVGEQDDEKTILAKAALIAQATIQRQATMIRAQQKELEERKPLALLGEHFLSADGTMTITQAARHFQSIDKTMSRDLVYGLLRGAGYIEVRSNAPTMKAIKPGYMVQRQFIRDGHEIGKPYSRFTAKGINWFIRRFIYGNAPTLDIEG